MTPSIKTMAEHSRRTLQMAGASLDHLTFRINWSTRADGPERSCWIGLHWQKRKTFRKSLPRTVVRWLATDGQSKRCALSHPPHDQRRQTDSVIWLHLRHSGVCLAFMDGVCQTDWDKMSQQVSNRFWSLCFFNQLIGYLDTCHS